MLTFDDSTYSQKLGKDFAKFCGLLRIYELYQVNDCSNENLVITGGAHFLSHCLKMAFVTEMWWHFFLVQKCWSPLTERLWQYLPKWKQPKWKFSIFCGLPGTTSYPYLPLRTIDPLDTRSHPQGGVQIYPQPNHLSKKGKKKYIPPNSDFS